MNVQFIKYGGVYPTACLGTLTFSYVESPGSAPKIISVESPLKTGGQCYDDGTPEGVFTKGKWRLRMSMFPYLSKVDFLELERLVNQNVPEGCCGGCLPNRGQI
ncbi:MAG: hypothetical protein LBV68_00020 [Spirochaetaceae bacterium]|nr:hypothetical protein [Spirochaetaceae bacterium]